MKILTLCLALSIPTSMWAQSSQTIRGSVIDSDSGEPVAYANVALYHKGQEQPLTGTFTNPQGAFTLKKVNPGAYVLQVQFVGYESYQVQDLEVDTQTGDLELGPLKLAKRLPNWRKSSYRVLKSGVL